MFQTNRMTVPTMSDRLELLILLKTVVPLTTEITEELNGVVKACDEVILLLLKSIDCNFCLERFFLQKLSIVASK